MKKLPHRCPVCLRPTPKVPPYGAWKDGTSLVLCPHLRVHRSSGAYTVRLTGPDGGTLKHLMGSPMPGSSFRKTIRLWRRLLIVMEVRAL